VVVFLYIEGIVRKRGARSSALQNLQLRVLDAMMMQQNETKNEKENRLHPNSLSIILPEKK
jgi:hypothetical protein